ncbi:MAG TPA: DUF255 domain-containing protein [Thermoanaerobaculia bacterium]|nr:DUF255 domain-containing protein [Thermoanaerobaculia bacterium]
MLRRLVLFSVLLINAASPPAVTYFNDHAGDRVKWEAWGKAAFDRAQKEGKPIALVVGSFAPHSSRTAHQALESDPATVAALNGRFVPILLDRAEWPAVAAAYAAASDRRDTADIVIYALTSDLEWLDVAAKPADLQAIADHWSTDRSGYLEDSRLKVRRLRARTPENAAPPSAGRHTFEQLRALDRSDRQDILGGGFFRAVPFFDKNLTDQANLASAYLEAAQLSGDARFAEVARNTLEYSVRDLQMRNGGFNDSQQADSLVPIGRPVIVEGAYYLWDRSEIMHTFGPKIGAELCERFGVGPGEKNILRSARTDTPDPALAAAMAKMLDIRLKRPMPARDEPILESSALIISVLARSNEDRFVRAAVLGGTFIQRTRFDQKTGQLWRRPGVPATANDHASLIQACIDLYEATLDAKWLDLALDMQGRQDVLFWNAGTRRYESGSEVPEPVRAFVVTPAALAPLNARSAINLQRLAAISGRDDLQQRSEALGATRATVTRVIIFGMPYRQDTAALMRAAQTSYDPMRVIVHGGDAKHPPSKNVRIGSLQPLPDGTATAHVCRAAGCSDALTTPEALAAALK